MFKKFHLLPGTVDVIQVNHDNLAFIEEELGKEIVIGVQNDPKTGVRVTLLINKHPIKAYHGDLIVINDLKVVSVFEQAIFEQLFESVKEV